MTDTVPAGFAAAGGNTGAAMPGGWESPQVVVAFPAEPGKIGGSSGAGNANSTLADTSLSGARPAWLTRI